MLRITMKQTTLRCLVLCFLVAGSSNAMAQITGSDSTEFESAIELWLAGHDRDALVALSALAQADNRAAQVFLGVIEPNTWLHDGVTSSLSREDRIALMRKPGGLSGRSWLLTASVDTPLAQDFIDSRAMWSGSAPGLRLVASGEIGAALGQLKIGYQSWDPLSALQIAMTPEITPYSSGLTRAILADLPIYAANDAFQINDPRIPEILAGKGPFSNLDDTGATMWAVEGSLSYKVVSDAMDAGNYGPLATLGMALSNSPLNREITSIVTNHCSQKPAQAMAALQLANYGTPLFTFTLSPVESLVSTQDYRSSPRFESDVLAHFAYLTEGGNGLLRFDRCAYDMVQGGA